MITCLHLCIMITASCTIKRCHCWWSLPCVEEWLKSLKSEAVSSTLMCVRRSRCRFCGLSQFTALKVYSRSESVSPKLPFNSSQHESSAPIRPVFRLSLTCHVHSQLPPSLILFLLPRKYSVILSCPPSGSVCRKSKLLGKTFHYLGLFALVLTLLVSTRAFSPFVLFYSFLWFMYSSLVSTIRDYILCLFHISHST